MVRILFTIPLIITVIIVMYLYLSKSLEAFSLSYTVEIPTSLPDIRFYSSFHHVIQGNVPSLTDANYVFTDAASFDMIEPDISKRVICVVPSVVKRLIILRSRPGTKMITKDETTRALVRRVLPGVMDFELSDEVTNNDTTALYAALVHESEVDSLPSRLGMIVEDYGEAVNPHILGSKIPYARMTTLDLNKLMPKQRNKILRLVTIEAVCYARNGQCDISNDIIAYINSKTTNGVDDASLTHYDMIGYRVCRVEGFIQNTPSITSTITWTTPGNIDGILEKSVRNIYKRFRLKSSINLGLELNIGDRVSLFKQNDMKTNDSYIVTEANVLESAIPAEIKDGSITQMKDDTWKVHLRIPESLIPFVKNGDRVYVPGIDIGGFIDSIDHSVIHASIIDDTFLFQHDYKCVDNKLYHTRETCEANGYVWDRPCKWDDDCPFYKNGEFGGCNGNGYCELPINVERTGFRKYRGNTDGQQNTFELEFLRSGVAPPRDARHTTSLQF